MVYKLEMECAECNKAVLESTGGVNVVVKTAEGVCSKR